MVEENKKNQRAGETLTTSVSVSKQFHNLINQHNLSPTECFRRGVAVTLYDLGVGMYQSDKNKERSKFMHEFLKKLDEDEEMKEKYEKMEMFEKLNGNLKKIQRIIKDIEGENGK